MLLAPLVLLALPGPLPGGEELYRKALSRSLERAQAELLSATDLWVDHSRWDDPWIVASEHFEVRTTHSHALAGKIAGDLEFLRGEWIKLLGEGQRSAGRASIWIFPSIATYNQLGEQYDEHSSMYAAFFAGNEAEQPAVALYDANHTRLGMWITHAATHQFLARSFGLQPETWIAEGLASYFALFWDWGYGQRELERLESSGRFVPLESLLRAALPEYVSSTHERFIELGMLFHFLLNSWEPTRNGPDGTPGPFQEYLRAAVRGQGRAGSEFEQTLEEASTFLEEDFRNFDFGQ
jgi:hypothetical protein